MGALGSLLIATDFSEDSRAAAARAAQLAAQHGAQLGLLHVLSARSLSALREWFALAADADAKLAADAQDELQGVADQLARDHGLRPPGAQVRVGQVVQEIVQAGAQTDLLVLGARGSNPLRDLILGTTAERVLKQGRQSTLVVKRAPGGPYRRVLVPVDFSPHSPAALRMALRIAPQAQVTVLHAFEAPYEGKLRLAGVSREQIDDFRQQVREQALVKLDGLLRAGGDPGRCVHAIEHGGAAQLILRKEEALDIDLIVIGQRDQPRLEDLLIGSVARHVLSDAQCDVLVVREPPGGSGA